MTEGTDHKAEAGKLLILLKDPDMYLPAQQAAEKRALVHSNLAIAEGQERVAEAIEGRVEGRYREALEDIANLTLAEDRRDDNKVREEVWHRTQRALEEEADRA